VSAVGVGVLVVGMALVACTGSPAPRSSPPTVPAPLSDAARFNLRASDFPAAWTAAPAASAATGAGDPETAALLACLHLPAAPRREVSDVDSDTFASPPTLQAVSNVTVVAPASLASEELTALQAPAGLTCLGRVIGQSVASAGAAVSGAKIQSIPAPVVSGVRGLGVHYSATFTEGSQSIDASTDEYFIVHGADEITATFTALEAVFPAAVEQAALAKLVARVRG
jgi:hypothetical protein